MLHSVPTGLDALVKELEDLRRRSYRRALDAKPLDLPNFFDVVERHEPALWEDIPRRVEAIERVLRAAITRLPELTLEGTVRGSTTTVREAALILFDLAQFDFDLALRIERLADQRYVQLARYLAQIAQFQGDEKAFQRKVTQVVKNNLARVLMSDAMKNPEGSAAPVANAGNAGEQATEDVPKNKSEPLAKFNLSGATITDSNVGDGSVIYNDRRRIRKRRQ